MNPFITLVIVTDKNRTGQVFENRKIRINFNQIVSYREYVIKRKDGTTTRSKVELNGSISYFTVESPEAIDYAISLAITNITSRKVDSTLNPTPDDDDWCSESGRPAHMRDENWD